MVSTHPLLERVDPEWLLKYDHISRSSGKIAARDLFGQRDAREPSGLDIGRAPGQLNRGLLGQHLGRNRLSLEAEASRDSLLVISQTWYPSWVASVDGRPTPLLKADGGALTALRLPAGKHRIELRYDTGFFKASGALFLLGLLSLGWLARRAKISATPL